MARCWAREPSHHSKPVRSAHGVDAPCEYFASSSRPFMSVVLTRSPMGAQFSEVYDTTFDIELSSDKLRWLDDFGVKARAAERGRSKRARERVLESLGTRSRLHGRVHPKAT
eukprot:6212179-Pleurochrysis_carterae.AAC.1